MKNKIKAKNGAVVSLDSSNKEAFKGFTFDHAWIEALHEDLCKFTGTMPSDEAWYAAVGVTPEMCRGPSTKPHNEQS